MSVATAGRAGRSDRAEGCEPRAPPLAGRAPGVGYPCRIRGGGRDGCCGSGRVRDRRAAGMRACARTEDAGSRALDDRCGRRASSRWSMTMFATRRGAGAKVAVGERPRSRTSRSPQTTSRSSRRARRLRRREGRAGAQAGRHDQDRRHRPGRDRLHRRLADAARRLDRVHDLQAHERARWPPDPGHALGRRDLEPCREGLRDGLVRGEGRRHHGCRRGHRLRR